MYPICQMLTSEHICIQNQILNGAMFFSQMIRPHHPYPMDPYNTHAMGPFSMHSPFPGKCHRYMYAIYNNQT